MSVQHLVYITQKSRRCLDVPPVSTKHARKTVETERPENPGFVRKEAGKPSPRLVLDRISSLCQPGHTKLPQEMFGNF